MSQLITNPTQPSDSEVVIDLIFSNCKYILNSGTLDWNVSDHIPVYIKIKKLKTSFQKMEFTGRSYTNFRQETFLDR